MTDAKVAATLTSFREHCPRPSVDDIRQLWNVLDRYAAKKRGRVASR
eukprot:CAMPEP_0173413024 /NCGR_PEP_ID=MMETSP1356-20130122/80956_1 /TAXON_ID=77927 ORGANISM="Hemiselmis virescens, Strain PCC157" /NCGR_SAMPLE_ID=MMETSP1356 /ASSEMBLY_ACC=CAM_ASM_000847 /LENGTH=46 /DNA_ID= /DNA_START= /DNA_END= /DNA_ORIENTATION=